MHGYFNIPKAGFQYIGNAFAGDKILLASLTVGFNLLGYPEYAMNVPFLKLFFSLNHFPGGN